MPPHPLWMTRHQPRAARFALRKKLKPSVSRLAQMNTVRMGLAVMISQTSPTIVPIVLVLVRMLATVVASCKIPPSCKVMVAGVGVEPTIFRRRT